MCDKHLCKAFLRESPLLQTNVPEPFSAREAEKLKEGVPEGLSDVVRERGQRWAMEDRLVYCEYMQQ